MTHLRWNPPGPYSVVFATRQGGVSKAPYATLNLGKKLGDDPDDVEENRRRLCAYAGADLHELAMNYQLHSSRVNRAVAGAKGEPGDGLWTDVPGLPILALAADCVPVALARVDSQPAVAVLHAGRIGVLGGIVAEGIRALGRRVTAAVGPAIGPCCYEVGNDIADAYRLRFGASVMRGNKLDLWLATELSLREAGAQDVERFDLCTACNPDLFFSYRRDGVPRGGQGVLALVA